jgi:hypothetical protein
VFLFFVPGELMAALAYRDDKILAENWKNGLQKQRRGNLSNPPRTCREVRPTFLQKCRAAVGPWTFPGTFPADAGTGKPIAAKRKKPNS